MKGSEDKRLALAALLHVAPNTAVDTPATVSGSLQRRVCCFSWLEDFPSQQIQNVHQPRVPPPSVFPLPILPFVSGGSGGGGGGGLFVVLMQDLIDLFAAAFICCASGS